MRGRGLEVADVFVIPWTDFRTLAPNHPDPAERAASTALFEDVLEFASALRSPGITILPGIDWEHEPPEESLHRAAAELGRRVEAARSRGVRLSIEPHLGSLASTPARALALLERVPGLELTLALSLMASIRERIEVADVPVIARRMGLVLVVASCLSMAFMGFAGMGSAP